MKIVTIKQPWASYALTGEVDVIESGIDLGTDLCDVLIHAAPWQQYDNSKTIPLEWLQDLSMAQLVGSVPLYEDMPFDCLIGALSVYSYGVKTESKWAYGAKKEKLYGIYNARLFTQPVTSSVPDEDSLPSYCKLLTDLPHRIFGDSLMVPTNRKLFDDAVEGFSFVIPVTDEFHEVIYGKSYQKPLKTISLVNGFRYKKFAFEADNDFFLAIDGKGKPKRYLSIKTGKMEVRPMYRVNLRKQL